ncbi:MAG: biotin/lipoyl-binding protein [Sandaracinaceae bacterium]|nr:biotin/lipoyl-binding protein [Sandaracinaceae bacterium]
MLASRAMKYRVTIDGEARDVDVVVAPDGRVSVSLDGKAQDVDVVRVPGGLSLRIDGRMFDVATGGKPEAMQLAAGEARAIAEILSDRMRARKSGSGGSLGSGATEIRAPMPGRVVKVLVSKGQSVELDDPAVVIEAMKMENELRAPLAGVVAEVLVSEGATVDGGAVLIRFEKPA